MRLALALILPASLLFPASATDYSGAIAVLERMQRQPGLAHASLGFAVVPVSDRENPTVQGYYPDRALVPASTMKAVTTASALELLGPSFRFTTRLRHTGTVDEDGILHGSLILQGGGDPTLGETAASALFERWRRALEDQGITSIEGRVIADDSLFGSKMRADGWQWNDLGNYYASGSSGLNYARNEFACRFKTGKAGTVAAFLGTEPTLPGVRIVNEMRVGPEGSGDQGYVYGAPYGQLLYLRGTVPAGEDTFTIRGALPDPAALCARAFSEDLVAAGLEVNGRSTTARRLRMNDEEPPGPGRLILAQDSPPLEELIRDINHRSDNLYADSLHRFLGTIGEAGDGSLEAASQTVVDYWNGQGLDLAGFAMADGSGLARTNTITARQLALILHHMAKSPFAGEFRASLPVAGKSGTLRKIGAESPAAGRVRAKSGSMDRVLAYCGYVEGDSGTHHAFALLINNFTGPHRSLRPGIVRLWSRLAEL